MIFSCANLGQSLKTWSKPHLLNDKSQRDEIERKGLKVFELKGKNREKWQLLEGYSVSKGIGFVDVNSEKVFISSEPDIVEVNFKSNWDFICVASKFFHTKLSLESITRCFFEGMKTSMKRNLPINEALKNTILLVLKETEADFVNSGVLRFYVSKQIVSDYEKGNKESFDWKKMIESKETNVLTKQETKKSHEESKPKRKGSDEVGCCFGMFG